MTTALTRPLVPTLADVFRPTDAARARMYDLMLIVGGSLFVAVCAQVAIPTGAIPMTLQTFAVMVVGALLGSKRGAAALALYLAEGAVGLPVFAGFHAGMPLLSSGYIVGFIPAAFVIGSLAERGWDRRLWTNFAAMLLGNAIVFAFGLAWLYAITTVLSGSFQSVEISSGDVLAVGLMPYIIADAWIKIAAATALLPLGWKLLGRRSDDRA